MYILPWGSKKSNVCVWGGVPLCALTVSFPICTLSSYWRSSKEKDLGIT